MNVVLLVLYPILIIFFKGQHDTGAFLECDLTAGKKNLHMLTDLNSEND